MTRLVGRWTEGRPRLLLLLLVRLLLRLLLILTLLWLLLRLVVRLLTGRLALGTKGAGA